MVYFTHLKWNGQNTTYQHSLEIVWCCMDDTGYGVLKRYTGNTIAFCYTVQQHCRTPSAEVLFHLTQIMCLMANTAIVFWPLGTIQLWPSSKCTVLQPYSVSTYDLTRFSLPFRFRPTLCPFRFRQIYFA